MTPLLVSGTRARRCRRRTATIACCARSAAARRPPARVFHRDETLSAYAEVVDVGAATRRDVELVTIVRDARDRDVVHSVRPNASDRAEPGHSFPYAIDIPLRTLPPGPLRAARRGARRGRRPSRSCAGAALRGCAGSSGRLTRRRGRHQNAAHAQPDFLARLALALSVRRRRPLSAQTPPAAHTRDQPNRSRKRPKCGRRSRRS